MNVLLRATYPSSEIYKAIDVFTSKEVRKRPEYVKEVACDVIGNARGITGPHVMMRADFRAGLARLTALGLSFDAWVFHPQLADVIDLARAFPDTTIIANQAV